MKHKVLFLCTGNSCRSQMAEAIVNAQLNDQWEAVSAGTRPANSVHPKTIRVLSEIGINHRGQPKTSETFRKDAFDLVVTVCDSAAEACPIWLGEENRVHLGFPDPATAAGSPEEMMSVFRQVRDDISAKVSALLNQWLIAQGRINHK